EATGAGPDEADLRITRTGERLGTPLYMAPEQLRNAPTDARADQFSFCVALYQALYGATPFAGESLDALARNVLAGRLQPAPPGRNVPAWLRRVLVRGLSLEREARWPTMEALVASLEADPSRRRKSAALGAGALLIVAATGVGAWRARGPAITC